MFSPKRLKQIWSPASQPALSVIRKLGCILGLNGTGHEANHSSLSSANIKNVHKQA
jgi:hypothetical protein